MADTTENLSLEDAAASIMAQPPEEADEIDTEDEVTEDTGAPETDEETEQTPADETEDEDDAPDVDDGEEDDIDTSDLDDENGSDEGEDRSRLFTVKVDGEEQTVSLEDLTRSYSGQAKIQKGLREAAEAKKQIEAATEQMQRDRQLLLQAATELQQNGLTPPTPPDVALASTDPVGYTQQKAEYDADLAKYQERVGMVQQQQILAQQQQQQQFVQFVQEQAQIVQDAIPELADPAKREAAHQRLMHTATSAYGYSETELNQITDARAYLVLNDAAKWREYQKRKADLQNRKSDKGGKKKLRSAPQKRTDSKTVARDKQRQKLRKSGSLDDAISLIMK